MNSACYATAIFLAILAVLVVPDEALAWGPGVHQAISGFLLGNLDLLPPAVAGLLAQHPQAFLYGGLSADFLVGKGSRFKPGHSHNWESVDRLLEVARTGTIATYALGYLAHLAADVVAHNHYVPGVLARTRRHGALTHLYVEMQADSRLTGGLVRQGRALGPLQREADRLLILALHKEPLVFRCGKGIFQGAMHVSQAPAWNRSLRLAQRLLPLPDNRANLVGMFTLSLRAALDALASPGRTVLRRFDPIGSANLAEVKRGLGGSYPVDPRLKALPPLPGPALDRVA